ncbi:MULTISPECIES: FAD:protein FMN transferase [Thiorhodovibrio]|uniref:FAD:protein FMN transferase n=1 Tax=Thiorhodovibrio TaxID=61593 RepID=UPI001F5DD11C|nr:MULTISPECIES: FAD:protein FMN transferase [Thiorhodovibrio]WPL11819.1 Thiamine biosynthesis lipoprotein ApbE precursor [Thiorhodovibrio litoralis]
MVLLVAALSLCACGAPDQAQVLELQGRTMGTSYSVQIAQPPADVDRDALQQAITGELERINAEMSTYDPASDLSRFNRSKANDWFPVPSELARVVVEAQRVSRLSDGDFDVTVGRLVNLWGFGPERPPERVPTPAAIAKTLDETGYAKLAVRTDPPALRKTVPGLYVDLSAIAKGYAVDRLAEILSDRGFRDYLVEVGGELRGAGQHPERPWRVAIERPESSARAVFRVVRLNNVAMATSGDYRNFFEQDGKLYSHTINPHTGRPVDHLLASVSVLDESCMRADALATALLVLGPEDGLALAEQQGIAAFLIERLESGYQAHMSSAFERIAGASESPNPSAP